MPDYMQEFKRQGIEAAINRGVFGALMGTPIYLNAGMEETEHYTVEVERDFRERWLAPFWPLRNMAVVPFEPWVMTKEVPRCRRIPSKEIIHTGKGFIMHPATFEKLKERIGVQG